MEKEITVLCPKCGLQSQHKFDKSWIIEGKGKGGTKQRTRIEILKCLACRRKWRRGINLNKEGS